MKKWQKYVQNVNVQSKFESVLNHVCIIYVMIVLFITKINVLIVVLLHVKLYIYLINNLSIVVILIAIKSLIMHNFYKNI